MAHQGRAQRGDLTGSVNEAQQPVARDGRGVVVGKGGQHRWLALGEDHVDHGRPDAGTAGDLDLVVDGRLAQQAHQVLVGEHRTLRDQRPGDVDVLGAEQADEIVGGPLGAGQTLGQRLADFAFGSKDKVAEDAVDQDLDPWLQALARR
jgi:hypothetical protein